MVIDPRARPFLEALAVFAFWAALLAWLVAGAEGILGVDGYYHFRIGEEILERGPWVDIRWLPFTVLGERGPDHHWLWHLLLAPFALLGHSLTAVKAAVVFTGALVPAALTLGCRWQGIPYAPLFASLAVTTSAVLPERYLMLRAQGMALVLTALALVAMTKRRYGLLGLVAFLFMQLYHGAVILVLVGAIWMLLQWLTTREFESRVAVAVGAGLFLGLLLSPWFPENVGYLVFHTIFKVGRAYLELAGTEWYPTVWPRLFQESWPAHVILAFASAGAIWAWHRKPAKLLQAETVLFLAVAFVFLVLYKSSWRFVDYYAPFAVLAAGLVVRDMGPVWREWRIPSGAAAACLVLAVVLGGWRSIGVIENSPKTAPTKYARVMSYLSQHGQPGDVVLNTHWTDFVQLVWHDPRFRYASGLDGHYLLYGDDADQFEFWFALRDVDNFEGEIVGLLAMEHFDARWIVVPAASTYVAELLQRDPHAHQVVSSDDGWLFELRAGRVISKRDELHGLGGGAPQL
jgi:hypothetical protein